MNASGAMAAGLLVISGAGLCFLVLAAFLTLRLARRGIVEAQDRPSVTILKPLHGSEPGLFEDLSSFCAQDYSGPVQIVFGVQNAEDAAIPVVRDIEIAFPDLAIDLVVDPTQHGSNRKISNLVNMAAVARHEIVVLADSDMRVLPDYLRRIVGELSAQGVGAVTCLYHGRDNGRVWSQLSRLGIDTHFLPSVAVGIGLGLAKPCFGSTIALTRRTLDALGGFRAFANDLADDYRLGEAVRGLGLQVVVPPFTIGHACPERSARDLLRQELRWVRTIRQIDPAGHAGSAVAHPLPFALLALAVAPSFVALGFAVMATCLRIGLCLAVEGGFGLRRHPYWLAPARDLLSFGIYAASFLGRDVSWRGYEYDVTSAGVMTPKREALDPR